MPAKKIDIAATHRIEGSGYPPPSNAPCQTRVRHVLGDAAGLTQFGVNLLRLVPGAWSSQRHWHTEEDEFVFVVAGTVTLVTDYGAEELGPGDCAGFRAGVADGHHLQNRSNRDALVLEKARSIPWQCGDAIRAIAPRRLLSTASSVGRWWRRRPD